MISQTAEYALRAVVFLGGQDGRPATTQRIAAHTRVPVGYLAKVMQALGRARLVDAQRGLRGGYVLARSLDDLTVLDVVNAVDPLRRIEHCPLGLEEHENRLCSLHQRLDQGIALVETFFQKTTVGQLLAEQREADRAPLCAAPPGSNGKPVAETTAGPAQ